MLFFKFCLKTNLQFFKEFKYMYVLHAYMEGDIITPYVKILLYLSGRKRVFVGITRIFKRIQINDSYRLLTYPNTPWIRGMNFLHPACTVCTVLISML